MRVEQVEPSSQNPTRKTDALPATKTRGATLNDDEFAREIEPLKRLQANIKRARTATVDAMLKFACEYAARYKPVKGDRKQVDRLDKALGLNYDASTRWRCVAAVAKRLEPIQKFLPAALEPLYVVTLALKADEGAVQKAIEEGRLTPDST